MKHLRDMTPSFLSTTQADSVFPDTRGSAMRDSRADLCQQQKASTTEVMLFCSRALLALRRAEINPTTAMGRQVKTS